MPFQLLHLKHDVFMNKEFRKYLSYAVGELVLVVVGILVALQIVLIAIAGVGPCDSSINQRVGTLFPAISALGWSVLGPKIAI